MTHSPRKEGRLDRGAGTMLLLRLGTDAMARNGYGESFEKGSISPTLDLFDDVGAKEVWHTTQVAYLSSSLCSSEDDERSMGLER
ncbi:hypothetical protein M6B38_221560 [Iris pallida]|uniref:Uncharacterized protein n=1 Tax=Iris pallida TaxID=29817 RepID=A0AAX6DWH6_IRIPA|nr:hypothetical protein M6B38_221560 [Iris pallida]